MRLGAELFLYHFLLRAPGPAMAEGVLMCPTQCALPEEASCQAAPGQSPCCLLRALGSHQLRPAQGGWKGFFHLETPATASGSQALSIPDLTSPLGRRCM